MTCLAPRIRGTLATALAGAIVLLAAQAFADEPPKKQDQKTAEKNLRKAQKAAKNADSTLNLLSKALYVGSILENDPDLTELAEFTGGLRKTSSEVKKHTDRIVELAEKRKDRKAAEKETKSLLHKVKLVRIKNQTDELQSLGRMVRELPVGLVSERVDNKFKVSADLLINDPKEAQARFKAYLTAMKTNAKYLKAKQAQLEDFSGIARGTGRFLARVLSGIEKAMPYSGIYAKALTEYYVAMDEIG